MYAQTTLECNTQVVTAELVNNYIIPDNIDRIFLTIKGGDGGNAKLGNFGCNVNVKGGEGATVSGLFEVGPANNQLKPGGLIKVFVGQKGENEETSCSPSPVGVYAAGGGSSAILYKAPGAARWRLLAEAGGGGGAGRPSAGIFRDGKGGNSSEEGRGTGNKSGGTVNTGEIVCPGNGTIGPIAGLTGIGGQPLCSAASDESGESMVNLLFGSEFSQAPIGLNPDSDASSRGGSASNKPSGGNGFNGGGAGGGGGGGGGGFGGGAVDGSFAGGGGGSFINTFFLGQNKTKTSGGDGEGEESKGFAFIRTERITPPIVRCQDATVFLNPSGDGLLTVDQINNGSDDACGTANFSLSITDFSCSDIGSNQVTLTATSPTGNSTCTANVEVIDPIAPVARCKPLVEVLLDQNGNGRLTPEEVDNGSSDNCPSSLGLSLGQTTFDCSDVGKFTFVNLVASDQAGSSTCLTRVTVVGPTTVEASCKDAMVVLDEEGNGTLSVDQVNNGSKDACGTASLSLDITDFTCADLGEKTVTLTVSPINGNASTCTSMINILDPINPTAECRSDVEVLLDENGMGTLSAEDVDNGSSDDCTPLVGLSLNQTTFDCADVGEPISVTLTVSDASGNVSTCTSNVTVEDNIPPVVVCQDVTVDLQADGTGDGLRNPFRNGALISRFDACRAVAFSTSGPSLFGCERVGTRPETIFIFDSNGNRGSCRYNLTVRDVTPPEAGCQNITVQLDATGNASIDASDLDDGSSDACGIANFTTSIIDFTCADIGENTVTLTISDVNGNVSTCTSTVTVEDNIAPVVVCQDVTVDLLPDGTGVGLGDPFSNGAIISQLDACSTPIISGTTNLNPDCGSVGTQLATIFVRDSNGNEGTCQYNFTVRDVTPPEAVCQNITIQLDDTGNVSIIASDLDGGSSDACGIANFTASTTDFTCGDVGENMVTLTVSDVNGSVSTCTSKVTVVGENNQRLSPVLEGIIFNPATGKYEACFGYLSDNTCTVNVPIGSQNKFTPGNFLGQPSAFLPGRQVGVFCVDLVPGETIVWTLRGPDGNTRTATASAPDRSNLIAYVWDDQNGNGRQEGSEPAIQGATVELVRHSDGQVLQTATSQADGTATFADLANYDGTQVKLKFYEKADHRFTLKDRGNNDNIDSDASRSNGLTSVFTLDIEEEITKWDCGLWSPGSVEAYVWDDQNGNGRQDNGEPAIDGVGVTLLESNGTSVLGEVETNSNGIATFSDVPADRPVLLQFAELDDYRFTLKDQGNNNNIDSDASRTNGKTATFQANRGAQVHTMMDAGLWSPGSVEAYVWDDRNGNGRQDNNEPALSGVTVKLLESDGSTELGSTTTDNSGLARFSDVPADRPMLLQFFELDDYRFTLKDRGNNDNIDSDASRTNGKTTTFQANKGGQVHAKMDAGLWSPGSVEAYVWDDRNGNGRQENDEPPLSGVTVKLLESDGTTELGSTTTDDSGVATFSSVPADRPMLLQFFELADYRFTLKDQGNNDDIDSDASRTNGKTGTFQAEEGGQVHTKVDAGLWSPGVVEAYVWDDQNGNGRQDNGEPALSGVTVKLLESDGTTELGITTTDDAGIARFINVPADRPMLLQFFELADYRFTLKDQGNNDNIDSDASRTNGKTSTFQADQGEQVHIKMDAGLWSPGSVEAYVWDDLNNNGRQDSNEPGLEGITVSLLESNGDVLQSTTSNSAGLALFSNVPADRSVKLQFGELTGYERTSKDQGNNDNIDSDASRNNGMTGTFTADRGQQSFTKWDAGYRATGAVLNSHTRQASGISKDDQMDKSKLAFSEVSLDQPKAKIKGFQVYPNPTQDFVNLNLEHYLGEHVRITIYSQTGQPVQRREIEGVDQSTVNLDVNRLPPGTYIIELRTTKDRQTKTLIITGQ